MLLLEQSQAKIKKLEKYEAHYKKEGSKKYRNRAIQVAVKEKFRVDRSSETKTDEVTLQCGSIRTLNLDLSEQQSMNYS